MVDHVKLLIVVKFCHGKAEGELKAGHGFLKLDSWNWLELSSYTTVGSA